MERPLYLNKLIHRMHNGRVKVITGVRRCGKSYLLFELFYQYLLEQGVKQDHIITMNMDVIEASEYCDPLKLYTYIKEQLKDDEEYYILLDEIQEVDKFEKVLISLLQRKNVDIYVTGSNARLLSKDIITEFRGRGDQVRVYPFSFAEYWKYYQQLHTGMTFPVTFPTAFSAADRNAAWEEYLTYGGMPGQIAIHDDQEKAEYLKNLFEETYIRDIVERNQVKNIAELEELMDIIASDIGGLTNPNKLANTFKSSKKVSLHPDTIRNYLEYYEDAFLIRQAKRYDIKGKKYISTPVKYYFADPGLRNARLNFRQIEEPHLMENIIYNELLTRGYNVDVGSVEDIRKDADGTSKRIPLEIDFVCNQGSERIYIQSAYAMQDIEKKEQEERPLIKIRDSFRKIIIVKNGITHYDENGIYILNLFDFLLEREDRSNVL